MGGGSYYRGAKMDMAGLEDLVDMCRDEPNWSVKCVDTGKVYSTAEFCDLFDRRGFRLVKNFYRLQIFPKRED